MPASPVGLHVPHSAIAPKHWSACQDLLSESHILMEWDRLGIPKHSQASPCRCNSSTDPAIEQLAGGVQPSSTIGQARSDRLW